MVDLVVGNYDRGYIDIVIRPRKVLVKVGKHDDDPEARTFFGSSVYIGITLSDFFIYPGGFTKDFPIGFVESSFHITKGTDGTISIFPGFG